MFPLGSVLMPGGVLPLHVFEPRYRQLVKDCLAADDPEFGVVMIERGSEVGGSDLRTVAGCVARIVELGELPDGRYVMVTVGARRIRVNAWLPDDPYPIADVDDWPDDDLADPGLGDAVAALAPRVRRAAALAVELGVAEAGLADDVPDDPLLASFHLARLAPVGPLDQHRLLRAPGAGQRLRLLADLLDEVEPSLRFRLEQG
jgi:Lon protease-like protein